MNLIHALATCILVSVAVSGCASPRTAPATAAEQSASAAGYERIKSLAGNWYLTGGERLGKKVEANLDEPFMSYAVSSGGHSVIEKLFLGKPSEMVSIYYLNMGRLHMDHYCSLDNQPRMVAIPSSDSNAINEIEFQMVEISNLPDLNDLHISSHRLEFKTGEPDELTVYWGATEDGTPFNGSVYHTRRMQKP